MIYYSVQGSKAGKCAQLECRVCVQQGTMNRVEQEAGFMIRISKPEADYHCGGNIIRFRISSSTMSGGHIRGLSVCSAAIVV